MEHLVTNLVTNLDASLGYQYAVTVKGDTSLSLRIKPPGNKKTQVFELSYPAGSDLAPICRAACAEAFLQDGAGVTQ